MGGDTLPVSRTFTLSCLGESLGGRLVSTEVQVSTENPDPEVQVSTENPGPEVQVSTETRVPKCRYLRKF